jgi:hypothetical protein
MKDKLPDKRSSSGDIQAFIQRAALTRVKARQPSARLIFAMDATASRQPTWDSACQLQGTMFESTGHIAGLALQLCYYRGFREFYSLPWLEDSKKLQQAMSQVQCRAGHTQLGRILRHALTEHRQQAVKALVFIGDAMEESLDQVCGVAGQLGLVKLPVFLFQEGRDAAASQAYSEIARLSGGVHLQFDSNSAVQLSQLLQAVAAYATGGQSALASQPASRLRDAMMRQLPGPG